MDAHEAKELANSMMRNSPLPDPERGEEKLLEDDGSEKLPKEGGGEKLPEKVPAGLTKWEKHLGKYTYGPQPIVHFF